MTYILIYKTVVKRPLPKTVILEHKKLKNMSTENILLSSTSNMCEPLLRAYPSLNFFNNHRFPDRTISFQNEECVVYVRYEAAQMHICFTIFIPKSSGMSKCDLKITHDNYTNQLFLKNVENITPILAEKIEMFLDYTKYMCACYASSTNIEGYNNILKEAQTCFFSTEPLSIFY